MEMLRIDAAQESHFNATFNEISDDLKIRLCRDTGSFVTCTICDAYHSRLRLAKTIPERKQIKELCKAHLAKQRKQREKYYKHKTKALVNRLKYLSIIILTVWTKRRQICPVMGRYTKNESPLSQRIIGVKVHGIRNYAFVVDEYCSRWLQLYH
jgi:hypothetical protein